MDPKTISAAKAIPGQFRELLGALFDESKGALKQGVGSLRLSLGKVEKYLDEIEREHITPEGPSTSKATKKKGTRRRGKRFPIAEFVMSQLSMKSTGMRPKDIAAAVKKEAPGAHKDAGAVVNSTLARLREQKKVKNLNGVWKLATGSAASVTTSKGTTKKAGKKKTAKRKAKKKSKVAKK